MLVLSSLFSLRVPVYYRGSCLRIPGIPHHKMFIDADMASASNGSPDGRPLHPRRRVKTKSLERSKGSGLEKSHTSLDRASAKFPLSFAFLGAIFVLVPSARCAAGVGLGHGTQGKFVSRRTTYQITSLDSSDQTIDVFYPSLEEAGRQSGSSPGKKFPLVSYAHGLYGGGDMNIAVYYPLLFELSSYGYVVAAIRACSVGCTDDQSNLPFDPPGFGHYYKQQLKVIEFVHRSANFTRFPTTLHVFS